MFGNGLVIALVRLQEPYYIFAIKQEIYENFGYVLDEPEESLENQPLHAFIAQSLNLELINIIL